MVVCIPAAYCMWIAHVYIYGTSLMLMLAVDTWLKLADQVVVPTPLKRRHDTTSCHKTYIHILPFIHMQLHIVMVFT